MKKVIKLGSNGKLIVIEGPDHVGRSLHARLLAERLEAHGVAVATIGLARSQLLGGLIKSHSDEIHQLNWRTRSLLYATDLNDQIIHDIQPLLDAGFVVIADRYTLTPIIREKIRGVNTIWIEGLYNQAPKPDLTIILHAGGRRLLNRIIHSNDLTSLNGFEAGMDLNLSPSVTTSFLEYQKLLREAFAEYAELKNIPIIPTKLSVKDVHKQIWNNVKPVVVDVLHEFK